MQIHSPSELERLGDEIALLSVDFQEYGTRPVQKHGTPGSRPLT
jgi:hypothetical protein